ncbi:hypothetical protein RSAG8_01609, partial [Rhizoctonia solani AG-8 WAC10335]
MRNSLPLRTPRLFLLGLTWAVSVVGAAAGLNAIVKRNDQVATIKQAVAALRITVFVNTNDLLRSSCGRDQGCSDRRCCSDRIYWRSQGSRRPCSCNRNTTWVLSCLLGPAL